MGAAAPHSAAALAIMNARPYPRMAYPPSLPPAHSAETAARGKGKEALLFEKRSKNFYTAVAG
jgi:hypothetical protein